MRMRYSVSEERYKDLLIFCVEQNYNYIVTIDFRISGLFDWVCEF